MQSTFSDHGSKKKIVRIQPKKQIAQEKKFEIFIRIFSDGGYMVNSQTFFCKNKHAFQINPILSY